MMEKVLLFATDMSKENLFEIRRFPFTK